jgi:hypothetical protein
MFMNKIKYTIGFVGPWNRDCADLVDTLFSHGHEFVRLSSLIDVSMIRNGERSKIDRLFVDVDSLGGVDTILEDLLELRKYLPGLPVVLISSGFSRDEFDLTRAAICDCSLKSPLSSRSIEEAISQSRINNMVSAESYRTCPSVVSAKPTTEGENLHWFASVGVATVAAMISGVFFLFQTQSWLYAAGVYILVGQLTLAALILLPWIKSRIFRRTKSEVGT